MDKMDSLRDAATFGDFDVDAIDERRERDKIDFRTNGFVGNNRWNTGGTLGCKVNPSFGIMGCESLLEIDWMQHFNFWERPKHFIQIPPAIGVEAKLPLDF